LKRSFNIPESLDRKRPGRLGSLTYNVWIDGKMNLGVFSDPFIENPQKQLDNANQESRE